MAEDPTLDKYLDAAAAVVGLNISPAYRSEVLANLERTKVIASLVVDFPESGDHVHSASVFCPGEVG